MIITIICNKSFDDYDLLENYINELNINIDKIIISNITCNSYIIEQYCLQHNINLILENDNIDVNKIDCAIIFWDEQSIKIRNIIKMLNNSCKDTYIYCTNKNTSYKFVQLKLDF